MAGRLFFAQIRKDIGLEIQTTSVAGIGTVPISQVAIVRVNFEFTPGLQSRQLNIACLLMQTSFSGAVCLPQSWLLMPMGRFGEDEGIIDDDWGFILIEKDSFVIGVFQVLMHH
jgi:hypothetical protein